MGERIKLNVKKPWQVAKGPQIHLRGGKMTPAPLKGTRGEKARKALREQE